MKEEIFVHYASALFSLAKEEGKLPAYLAEMRDVLNTLKDNPDFVAFCASYRIPNENAYSLLETVFGSLKCKSIVPFLKLVVTKHLFSHIEDICEAFFSLCNEELGINLESEDYDSIAGHIINLLDHFPKTGERVSDQYAEYIVLAAEKNRIDKVKVHLLPQKTPEEISDTEISPDDVAEN